MKIRLNQYTKSVAMCLRQAIIFNCTMYGGIDRDEEHILSKDQLTNYLACPSSHSIKSVGPKTVEFICKEFDIQPPDAWKIRINKYHEDRKDKIERKIKKERYVTVKINKIQADLLVDYLKANSPTPYLQNLFKPIIEPLQQKFDWKE